MMVPVPTADLIIYTGSARESAKAERLQGGFDGIEIHKSAAQMHIEIRSPVKTLWLRTPSKQRGTDGPHTYHCGPCVLITPKLTRHIRVPQPNDTQTF